MRGRNRAHRAAQSPVAHALPATGNCSAARAPVEPAPGGPPPDDCCARLRQSSAIVGTPEVPAGEAIPPAQRPSGRRRPPPAKAYRWPACGCRCGHSRERRSPDRGSRSRQPRAGSPSRPAQAVAAAPSTLASDGRQRSLLLVPSESDSCCESVALAVGCAGFGDARAPSASRASVPLARWASCRPLS